MRTQALCRRLETLTRELPPPKGYHYQFDRNGGNGAPYYYNLAVVRDDQKGGDFLDLPSAGGYAYQAFIKFIDGMIAGLRLQARLTDLPDYKMELCTHDHQLCRTVPPFCCARDDGWGCTRPLGHEGPHIACGQSEGMEYDPKDHNYHTWR
jgi:hypothetical protein